MDYNLCKPSISESLSLSFEPIYDPDAEFNYFNYPPKTKIGDKITIEVKYPTKEYEDFKTELQQLILKYALSDCSL